ncbi:hypothetical protein [Methylobacterium sp. J-076]|uniref:hypothetical protein n=1 Tax=Methylobacterium sp. J-076 TaxID=2836655 RepID=UPI001FB9E8F9|nr:hypothetical protein [Methylobacterium sp. J-076]MCJ2012628.1 hypothetical protein [Methylobacterium sp. J-076]
MTRLADLALRPLLVRLAGAGALLALMAGAVLSSLDASGAIEAARERLDRAQARAAQAPVAPPLVAADGDALLAAFRGRLDTLAADRAVIVDAATLEADPARPGVPRLRGTLRGTAEGLHGLAYALETGTPPVAVEEADLGIERPADSEIGRPLLMRMVVTARGVVVPPAPAPRRTP